VLDGILLERGGVPAVSIVTDLFVGTGEAMARSWGVPGYQFLSLLHPIANLTDWELDQRARDIVPKIVELLRK
jgi:hypothetical protein